LNAFEDQVRSTLGKKISMTTAPASLSDSSTLVSSPDFVDRRQQTKTPGTVERRQFGNSYRDLSPEAKDLAEAIDAYKLQNRRRYITTEELIGILTELGYQRP
jgi:hypothetical protein